MNKFMEATSATAAVEDNVYWRGVQRYQSERAGASPIGTVVLTFRRPGLSDGYAGGLVVTSKAIEHSRKFWENHKIGDPIEFT